MSLLTYLRNGCESQITSLTIVYLIVYSDADQRKHQSSASLAFVRGIHREPTSYAENVSIWWRHHGIAFSETRDSSHDLEVDRGRYVWSKRTIMNDFVHHVMKIEEHLINDWCEQQGIEKKKFDKISLRESGYANWTNRGKLCFKCLPKILKY